VGIGLFSLFFFRMHEDGANCCCRIFVASPFLTKTSAGTPRRHHRPTGGQARTLEGDTLVMELEKTCIRPGRWVDPSTL